MEFRSKICEGVHFISLCQSMLQQVLDWILNCQYIYCVTLLVNTTVMLAEMYGRNDVWTVSNAARKFNIIFSALMHVAACDFQLIECLGARVGKGMKFLDPIMGYDETIVVWWQEGHRADWSWRQHGATMRVIMEHVWNRMAKCQLCAIPHCRGR